MFHICFELWPLGYENMLLFKLKLKILNFISECPRYCKPLTVVLLVLVMQRDTRKVVIIQYVDSSLTKGGASINEYEIWNKRQSWAESEHVTSPQINYIWFQNVRGTKYLNLQIRFFQTNKPKPSDTAAVCSADWLNFVTDLTICSTFFASLKSH